MGVCRLCNAKTSGTGCYCLTCKTKGVVLACAWCGKSLTLDPKKYDTAMRRNPERKWTHTECKSDWLQKGIWTDAKRAATSKQTTERNLDADYRKLHAEKTAEGHRTEKARAKASTSASKRFQSQEQRDVVSNTLKDYNSLEENRQLRRETAQKFWDSDAGIISKFKISNALGEFWTDEQRQRKAEFLQEFYQTDLGLAAREAMSQGRIDMFASELGVVVKESLSAKSKSFFNDPDKLAIYKESLKKYWQSDSGIEVRTGIADRDVDTLMFVNMQMYWPTKSEPELLELHRDAHLRHYESNYWEELVTHIKSIKGVCTRNDLSRATGLPYSVVSLDSKGIHGLSNNTSELQRDVTTYISMLYTGTIITDSFPAFLKVAETRRQLDIYIPDKNLAIEVNGTYWHSEQKGKDKNYHYSKSKLCRAEGIRLIHIWEHEWNNPVQQAVLKSILQSALGLSKTVYARKLQVQYKKSAEMREFFTTNNIQGFRGGEFAVCLVEPATREVLLAYLIGKGNHFSKGYKYEVIRGACKLGYSVVGGFSKAFKHLFADHTEFDNVIYYIDYNYFDGKSLQSNTAWKFNSEAVSFKNYFVATGEVKNRNPRKHAEITQGYAAGTILKLWNAGVAGYVYKK